MDSAAEKPALEEKRASPELAIPQITADDKGPIEEHQKNIEKDEIQEKPANRRQKTYLSVASSTGAHRESIETAHRASTVLSDSDDEEEPEYQAAVRVGQEGEPARPQVSRGADSAVTVLSSVRSLPSLRRRETKLAQKEAHPWEHLGITLGGPMIIIFDLIVPCIIYYVWYNSQRTHRANRCREEFSNEFPCPIQPVEYNKDILGYSIVSFGFGELWILLARVYRLVRHRGDCAPLLSRSAWELDATSWVYSVALILGLIPFVVASDLQIPRLYLYSPSFIMAFLGLLMVVTTLFPFKLPLGINSQPRNTRLRPFIYYAAEDFIAVDGLQDREFRVRYNDRYETNRMFRRFFFNLTLWWILGVVVYIGSVSAVIWSLEFHYAFGLSFGVLFSYIAVWAGVTFAWVNYEMKREHLAYEAGEVEA